MTVSPLPLSDEELVIGTRDEIGTLNISTGDSGAPLLSVRRSVSKSCHTGSLSTSPDESVTSI